MAHGLERIDWLAPWLAPYRTLGEPLARLTDEGLSCAQALNRSHAASPVRFVGQMSLPTGTPYEQFIAQTASVPTRDGAHDFFNGLVWLHFPRAKQRLNQLQAQAIGRDGVAAVRGALRDAVTVFDENAALLCAPDELWQALAARDWARLFGKLRPLWDEAQLFLFGHALMEKLIEPRKAITAHVLRVGAVAPDLSALDGWLSQHLEAEFLISKPYHPLPVLGIPGWWPGNQEPDFYDDPQVFRAHRAGIKA